MKFTTIDLHQIDTKDERFRISWFFSLNELETSIDKSGLLNPPVVTLRENRLVIVSGWKRVFACRNLALPSLPVFVTHESSDLKVFSIPIYENLTTREYSQVEKAEIIAKLIHFGAEKEEITRRFLPLMKIPIQPRFIDHYLAIAEFEPELKAVIHSKNPDISILQLLTEMGSEGRMMLLPLLEPLGKNKQKELVSDIFELCQKEGISIGDIFKRPEIAFIAGNKRLSPLQKADNIRRLVKALRNPAQNAWQQAFAAVLKELGVSKGIVISPAPFFEEEAISLNFSFKSRDEFLQKLTELKKLAGKKDFAGLFDIKADD